MQAKRASFVVSAVVLALFMGVGCNGDPTAPEPEEFTEVSFIISYERHDPSPGEPRPGREFFEEEVTGTVQIDGRSGVKFTLKPTSANFMNWDLDFFRMSSGRSNKYTFLVSNRGTKIKVWLQDRWRWTGDSFGGSRDVAYKLFIGGREIGGQYIVDFANHRQEAHFTLFPDGSFGTW